MPDKPDDKKIVSVNPFPDLGGLYLLIVGLLLGVLLGPAVLGRLTPTLYRDVFVGGGGVLQQIQAQQDETARQVQALEQTDVTDIAITEQLAGREQQLVVLKAQLDQAQRERLNELTGWVSALMLAVIAIMMIESLLSPDFSESDKQRVPAALGRLITARYALAALWIAIMLAQPALLKQLPVLFVALLIVVALAAALVPLGKKTV